MKKLAVIGVVALTGAVMAKEITPKILAAKDGFGNLVIRSDGGPVSVTGCDADKVIDGVEWEKPELVSLSAGMVLFNLNGHSMKGCAK